MKNHNMSSIRSVRPAPVEIVHKHMRFLIIHNPDKNGMEHFIKELKQRQIKEVVRVCEPTYDAAVLKKEDIEVMDMAFDDGGVPSSEIIDQWLALLKMRFKETPKSCVAVHCVAGLGRAPLMVALALMEAGMTYEDAVAFVREKRRGAINAKQLHFLERYKPRLRMKAKNGSKGEGCCLM